MTLAHTQAEKRSANMTATLLLTGGDAATRHLQHPHQHPVTTTEVAILKMLMQILMRSIRQSGQQSRREGQLNWLLKFLSKEGITARKAGKQKSEPDPVTINGLRKLLDEGKVTEFTPMRACGVQIWRPMRRVPQLKWQLLMKDGDDHEDSDDEEARELSQYALDMGDEGVESSERKNADSDAGRRGSTPLTPTSGRTSSNSVTGGSSTFEVAGEGKRFLSPEIGRGVTDFGEALLGCTDRWTRLVLQFVLLREPNA